MKTINVNARTFNDALNIAMNEIKKVRTDAAELYPYKDYDMSTSAEIRNYSGHIIGHMYMDPYNVSGYTIYLR